MYLWKYTNTFITIKYYPQIFYIEVVKIINEIYKAENITLRGQYLKY